MHSTKFQPLLMCTHTHTHTPTHTNFDIKQFFENANSELHFQFIFERKRKKSHVSSIFDFPYVPFSVDSRRFLLTFFL